MFNSERDLVETIAVKAAPRLTENLRTMAEQAGWPEEAVQSISVKLVSGDLQVKIARKHRDLVNALEYGGMNTPPKPVLVRFTPRIPEMIKDIVSVELTAHISDVVRSL